MAQGLSDFAVIRRKLICDYFDKYPDASQRSLARILHKDHPLIFSSIEQSRSIVRIYRGTMGNRARHDMKFTKYFKHDKMA